MTTMSKPLILVGAGGMGRMWLQAILEEPGAELAGIVDLDIEAAQAALEALDVQMSPQAKTQWRLLKKLVLRQWSM